MQLVIELTDEQWKCVQDGTWCGTKEILNGIPLPKGHGRLIDGDALKDQMKIGYKIVENAPTVIEADKAEGSEE